MSHLNKKNRGRTEMTVTASSTDRRSRFFGPVDRTEVMTFIREVFLSRLPVYLFLALSLLPPPQGFRSQVYFRARGGAEMASTTREKKRWLPLEANPDVMNQVSPPARAYRLCTVLAAWASGFACPLLLLHLLLLAFRRLRCCSSTSGG